MSITRVDFKGMQKCIGSLILNGKSIDGETKTSVTLIEKNVLPKGKFIETHESHATTPPDDFKVGSSLE
jgi:hypothetical protein